MLQERGRDLAHAQDKEPTQWSLQAANEVEFANWFRALSDFVKPSRARRSAV